MSNMCGELKELQALFIKDCSYAYYVLCFALVASYRGVVFVHNFFLNLNFIVNVVGASCKCFNELQAAQEIQIAHIISIDELESEK